MATQPTDKEAISIIRVLMSGGFETEEDDERNLHYLLQFWPTISDIIFHGSDDLTAEEILKKAKQEKPIQL